MAFAGKIWRLLVGIKDGLALIFLLLFFIVLFSVLSARPNAGDVRDGALFLPLDGFIVEERSPVDPLEVLMSQQAPLAEYPVSEMVHALETAADDDRIEAVVFDLSGFMGGGQVHMQEISAAIAKVRAAEKPVLVYSLGYGDDAMMLAAHASEVWLDPLGGAVIAGPGGERMYYAGLIERLNVNTRVYRVGTYKSAVEPFTRSDMSPEARENYAALYGSIWEEWKARVKTARPKMQLDRVVEDTVNWVEASQGDLAKAALDAGLVDKLGTRVEFGERVAEIAGEDDWSDMPGSFAATELDAWVADNPPDTPGEAIGIVTVEGELVDGYSGPGIAGGDRISELLDEALEEDLAALVVRVDSPGGSVMASELIRNAILRHKAKDIPVAISFGNVAASGGYWVATAGDRIFAEPETITGSIGVFAVVPTFERAAAEWGVGTDGYRTTPLSGQPDLVAGFTPEVDAILQSGVEDTYSDFIGIVAEARGLTRDKVDEIGQGRVWDGGTARQLGLVDQFGGLDTALEWAAKEAGLEEGDWHPLRLGADDGGNQSLLGALLSGEEARTPVQGDMFAFIARREAELKARLGADLERLSNVRGVQAYCLECPSTPRVKSASASPNSDPSWWQALATILAR
jgi:protease-4